jgi:hypothetical protein
LALLSYGGGVFNKYCGIMGDSGRTGENIDSFIGVLGELMLSNIEENVFWPDRRVGSNMGVFIEYRD